MLEGADWGRRRQRRPAGRDDRPEGRVAAHTGAKDIQAAGHKSVSITRPGEPDAERLELARDVARVRGGEGTSRIRMLAASRRQTPAATSAAASPPRSIVVTGKRRAPWIDRTFDLRVDDNRSR